MLSWTIALAVVLGFAISVGAEEKAGNQQPKSLEKEVTVKVKLNYLLYLPEGYGDGDKAWPLVLFLHGAGETGNDLELVTKHGPPKQDEEKKFPSVLVS